MAFIAASIEGPVQSIAKVGGTAVIKVMGMTVIVDPSVEFKNDNNHGSITSPSAHLTIDQLTSNVPLPGRFNGVPANPIDGFVGGTVIAAGNFDTSDGFIHVKMIPLPANQGLDPFEAHPSIQIEPGESVIEGPVTLNAADFKINGTKIVMLPETELRIPGAPFKNEEGFAIKVETVALNSFAVANGYFGNDGVFHAYEVNAIGDLASNTPQVSVIKAEARNTPAQHQLKARGFVTTAHIVAGSPAPRVGLYRKVNGVLDPQPFGRATAKFVAGKPFARWDFDESITNLQPPRNEAPDRVFVKFENAPNPSSVDLAQIDVDIRFD